MSSTIVRAWYSLTAVRTSKSLVAHTDVSLTSTMQFTHFRAGFRDVTCRTGVSGFTVAVSSNTSSVIRTCLRFRSRRFRFRLVSGVFRDVGVLFLGRRNLQKRTRNLIGIDSHRTRFGCRTRGTRPSYITQAFSVEANTVSTAFVFALATSLAGGSVPVLFERVSLNDDAAE